MGYKRTIQLNLNQPLKVDEAFAGWVVPQIIKLQSRSSKVGSNLGPLIAGFLVLILTATVLYITANQKNQLARPQAVVLEQTLDKKINIAPSSDNTDAIQPEDSTKTLPPGANLLDGEKEMYNHFNGFKQCIIIVGAFNRQSNVENMIYQIVQQSSFKPIVLEGSLTKVGFTFDCDDKSWVDTLAWARETFNKEAWLYKN